MNLRQLARVLSATMNSPLFDTHLIATNLERAYEAMRELRAMALPCSHIGERGGVLVILFANFVQPQRQRWIPYE